MPPKARRAPRRTTLTRLRMASRRSAVAPMVERTLKIVARAGLSQERCENLAVALAEALSNAAVHGHRDKPGSRVLLVVMTKPDGCVVVDVKDSGPGFDVASLVDPTDPKRLLVPGGRGVFMMRRLVDRVEYNPRGNHVRLILDAQPSP